MLRIYLSGAYENPPCHFAPQNCPQKGLERVSTMQHLFVHMGQNLFRALVRNTSKPDKTTPKRTNFRFLITRRPQVQVMSPQPKDCDRKDVTVFFFGVTLKNAAAILSEPPAASRAVHARSPLQSAGRVL